MLATTLVILFALLAVSVPVAAVMGVLSLALSKLYASMPLELAMGEIIWSASSDYILIAVPLFILMGEILLRAGIAERVYEAIAKWLSWLPGGLMHVNVGAAAMFAATSGSSVATAATIGTVAVPQIKKHGYHEPLFLGTIAAGGTLGILIPPSINFILYGLLTNTSVPKLYLAGFVPGFLLAALFGMVVLITCLLDPKKGGRSLTATWRERFTSLPTLIPPTLIFLVVVGSIYAGVATPTEAASLGVVAAMALAFWHRRVSAEMLLSVVQGTMRTTAMVMLIIIAAQFLNFVLAAIGMTNGLTDAIEALGLGKYGTLLAIIALYLFLGLFMETMSIMILTTPFIAPIVFGLGWDPIWWGVVLTILIEVALITPPVGLNLYVVQSMRGRGPISDVIIGTIPFVIAMLAMIGMLIAYPQIALWMPEAFSG